ncbi:Asp-tRNA(Asn)/Glu-tRNA(Gln) amidotransferase subunit GatA, partial [Candidatus Aerophobetes bacterium]|nr:Asp-tRNA(Asn)/Glu-tRNA(Gln) amidotransferase subunit GatA [Candidatus Aerophobetes bacterium]
MDDIFYLPAHRVSKLIRAKQISIEELILAQFKRIDEVEEKIKAFLFLDREEALNEARVLDKKIQGQNQEISPLYGIPVAIKDNMCTKNGQTTCASRILNNFHSPYAATVVERVKKAGCIIIGKTNLDEFAMGSSTENSAFQVTCNPWNLEAIPGGSSGGSAAAVASGEVPLALGSDTGGSIRQPAALCGIVGMKPTYGRVSRYGLVAFASSLDQIGPLSRDVTDCALLLGIISGKDERDSTSVDVPVPDYLDYLIPDLKGVKVGLPKEYFVEGMEKEVKERIYQAAKVMEDLGAKVEETSLP